MKQLYYFQLLILILNYITYKYFKKLCLYSNQIQSVCTWLPGSEDKVKHWAENDSFF